MQFANERVAANRKPFNPRMMQQKRSTSCLIPGLARCLTPTRRDGQSLAKREPSLAENDDSPRYISRRTRAIHRNEFPRKNPLTAERNGDNSPSHECEIKNNPGIRQPRDTSHAIRARRMEKERRVLFSFRINIAHSSSGHWKHLRDIRETRNHDRAK